MAWNWRALLLISALGLTGLAASAAVAPARCSERDLREAEVRARSDREAARAAREDDLLQRAMANSPDYLAALRRAAVANVENAEPDPAGGRGVMQPLNWEQRVAAEEARLTSVIGRRRRELLGQ